MKIRGRTFAQISNIPEPWKRPFLSDLRGRVSGDSRMTLDTWLSTEGSLMLAERKADRVSDTLSGNSGVNTNTISIYKNNTNGGSMSHGDKFESVQEAVGIAMVEMQKMKRFVSKP